MLKAIVVAVIASLVAAAVVAIFRARQLYLVVPKLFNHSHLSKGGMLVEMSVINRGRRPEHQIKVRLDDSLGYEMVASTDPDAVLQNKTICLDRLGPRAELSIILEARGGKFDKSSISSFTSSDSGGRVIDKPEDAPPNWGQLLVPVLFFAVLVGSGIYVVPAFMDEVFSAEPVESSGNVIDPALTAAFANAYGSAWQDADEFLQSGLAKDTSLAGFPIQLGEPVRAGDWIRFDVELFNRSAGWMKIDGRTASLYEEEYDTDRPTWFHDQLLPAGARATRALFAHVPKGSEYPEIVLNFTISSETYDSLHLEAKFRAPDS